MSEPLHGVVVCHGELAQALVGAVEEISGIRGALTAVSNAGRDRNALEEQVLEAVVGRPGLVFVDLPSGSCLFAAMRRLGGLDSVRVVTGVNLAMLLEFVFHRDADVEVARARAIEAGSRAIGGR
ncbi:MAG: PTS sugar transporter subunit IIA [Gemmatimonadales bacterium]